MSLSHSMAVAGEDLIGSLKARLELLDSIHNEVKGMLVKYNRERLEMSGKLKEILADDRLNRIEEVNKLIASYCEDRTGAHEVWEETLKKLGKIRSSKHEEFKPKKELKGKK
ncbi:MAG: hypothetical protein A4E55_02203 [Pelotomaculum sp. PtaU1.Bin035]|nr:MAG: hypothetical protein A4E55_02203 [Pelotomaculum sp. PtaU1.Bin035]